jgi:hypothetical protein
MEKASDQDEIDLKALIKSLEPDEYGKFEPMSGVMLLNISGAEFDDAYARYNAGKVNEDDLNLIKIINHEAYHFIQTGASGYVFDRQCQLFSTLKASLESPSDLTLDPKTNDLITRMRAGSGDDPYLKQRTDLSEQFFLFLKNKELQEARARPGDYSVSGAYFPEFFRHMDEVAEHEAVPNADGLSIRGVLESSAVAWGHQVICEVMKGDARAEIEVELATLDEPVYRELYALTREQVGDRAVELMLPAVALALCYGEPHNAYKPMLSALAVAPSEGVLECGRRIAADLPALPQAGPILGTSVQVRRAASGAAKDYLVYDSFIQDLESQRWGVDAYAVLAEPSALGRMGTFPKVMVTNDSCYFDGVSREIMIASATIMSLVLRVASRKREERTTWGVMRLLARTLLLTPDIKR